MLVAHEPPAMRELPDAKTVLAASMDMHETYLRSGFGPAMSSRICGLQQGRSAPGVRSARHEGAVSTADWTG